MKVDIGKYVDWVSVHNLEQWCEEKGLSGPLIEKLFNFLQSIINFVWNNRFYGGSRKRKVKVKIDDWDTWGAHHTLALIILPLLEKLREEKHGSPYVENGDVPIHLRASKKAKERFNKFGDTDDKFHERWDWVMGEMIWAFQQIVKDDESEFFDDSDFDWDGSFLEGIAKIKIDQEGLQAYRKRIQNGTRLFGKYYQNLWD